MNGMISPKHSSSNTQKTFNCWASSRSTFPESLQQYKNPRDFNIETMVDLAGMELIFFRAAHMVLLQICDQNNAGYTSVF